MQFAPEMRGMPPFWIAIDAATVDDGLGGSVGHDVGTRCWAASRPPLTAPAGWMRGRREPVSGLEREADKAGGRPPRRRLQRRRYQRTAHAHADP